MGNQRLLAGEMEIGFAIVIGFITAIAAIIVYPLYNVATILMISIIGILIFKEQLEIRKRWGLALIIAHLSL